MFHIIVLLLIPFVLPSLPPTHSGEFMEANIDYYGICSRSLLMPGGRRARVEASRKPPLLLGEEEPPLIEHYIESIPAEARIETLRGLLRCSFCRELSVLVDEADSEQIRVYSEYSVSSMYLGAGVLRLLYRYALNALRPEETHIKTVNSMLIYIQNYFEKKYNQSLDYLTPRLLKEWYDLLGDSSKFLICAKHKFIREERIPDNAVVKLNIGHWQDHILRPRITSIRTLGYETITH